MVPRAGFEPETNGDITRKSPFFLVVNVGNRRFIRKLYLIIQDSSIGDGIARNAAVLVLIVILCFSSFQFLHFASTASSTALYLDPSTIEVSPRVSFTVALNVDNVTDLHDWQAQLNWDPQILNCDSITDGDFFNSSVFSIISSVNQPEGWAYMWRQLESGHTLPGVNGSGTLAIIQFHGIADGECTLSLNHTKLFDSNPELVSTPPNLGDTNNDSIVNMKDIAGVILSFWSSVGSPQYNSTRDFNADGFVDAFDMLCCFWNFNRHYPPYPELSQAVRPLEIPHNTSNANVNIIAIHDITVEDVTSTKTIVGTGYSTSINATVANEVCFAETFNVTLYANEFSIALQNVTLAKGASATLCFTWNTTGFACGNYDIRAYAWPVPGENNTADNNCTGWTFEVTIPGDINGDFTVDIYDAIILAGAYNSQPTSHDWNANADISGDNIVDIYDAIILAAHFNQHVP